MSVEACRDFPVNQDRSGVLSRFRRRDRLSQAGGKWEVTRTADLWVRPIQLQPVGHLAFALVGKRDRRVGSIGMWYDRLGGCLGGITIEGQVLHCPSVG